MLYMPRQALMRRKRGICAQASQLVVGRPHVPHGEDLGSTR